MRVMSVCLYVCMTLLLGVAVDVLLRYCVCLFVGVFVRSLRENVRRMKVCEGFGGGSNETSFSFCCAGQHLFP